LETLADTLIDRVDKLIQANKAQSGWGSPRVSTTPIRLAVQALAAEIAALEDAVREVALEVQKLTDPD
jgi:hypothetical protein